MKTKIESVKIKTQCTENDRTKEKRPWKAMECQGAPEETEGKPGGPGRGERARGEPLAVITFY